MKKTFKYILILLTALTAFSCSDLFNRTYKTGSASISFFFPDYQELSESGRAISPETTAVKFSYIDPSTKEWISTDSADLSTLTKSTAENAPVTFPGSSYTLTVQAIPEATYSAGSMKIELLNAEAKVLTSAVNSESIMIKADSKAKGYFFTKPADTTNSSGSLRKGEMKFYSTVLKEKKDYVLNLSVTGENYPDIVFFNQNWAFEEYHSVTSASDAAISLGSCSVETELHIGIWADHDNEIENYTISIEEVTADPEASSFTLIDFETDPDESEYKMSGLLSEVISSDPTLEKWPQKNLLTDRHGKVLKLSTFSEDGIGHSQIEFKVNAKNDSALSFEYKLDTLPIDYLIISIDGTTDSIQGETGKIWKKATYGISSGEHSVILLLKKTQGMYSSECTNSVYIDNISIAENVTSSVEIYPKGKQETYAEGTPIQFSAKALRADGSEISGKKITWTATGGTISSTGLFTPGSVSGTYKIKASADGKTVCNSQIVVHGKDYLSESVTIAGQTYTGRISSLLGDSFTGTTDITFTSPSPSKTSFEADGFFVLKGHSEKYVLVKITYDRYNYEYILPKGDFHERIWLRFGSQKEYTVLISEIERIEINDTGIEGCQGDYGRYSYYTSGSKTVTLSVTNSHTQSTSEDRYLLPSMQCQSDDFTVLNTANAILSELPENASDAEKLQALHDWIIHNFYYDNMSANIQTKRKAQDAVNCLKNMTAVCEGYANIFTAFERVAGIKGQVKSSQTMNHAWNYTYCNEQWLLVDVTWDDPVLSNASNYKEIAPYDENYTYFLITDEQDKAYSQSHDCTDLKEVVRSIAAPEGETAEGTYTNAEWY